jgi:pre-mRNA-splicing factor RBM22/SLT11
VNDPVALKLLNKAGEMPSLEPPDDESIKTLYVGGLNERVTEQDLRDNFYAHGEIESIRMVPLRACAFVTYTTREGAEKAAEELSNKLVIKGLRLKLMWGRPQAPKPDSEGSDEARQQAAVAHSGMLPRAIISQQQSQLQPQDQNQPMHYFNIPPPPPPQQERAYYPSMDPQRMGALVPSHEGPSNVPSGSGENKSGSEKQQQAQRYAYQGMPPPPGQYHHQFYPPPYGYMPPMSSYQQQYPPQYHSAMLPPQPPPMNQHYQHSAPSATHPGSAPPGSAAHAGSTPSGSAQLGSSPAGSTPPASGPSGSSTPGSSQQ